MGEIRSEVFENHLAYHSTDEAILKPFLSGFDVTWGRTRFAYNTELSVFFLKPEPFITESYGFEREILLVYSKYPTLEARTLQAAESFLTDSPAKGRTEQLNYFLVSEDPNMYRWLQAYLSDNLEARIIVAFNASELRASKGDSWYVRNVLNKQLFGRDLFDYRLPLQKDTYFFGRQALLMEYADAIKRGENRGLFGLRKTGKTSFLYKLERLFKFDRNIYFFYYDCKLPSVRKLRWFELLKRISDDISKKLNIRPRGGFSEIDAAQTFEHQIARVSKENKRVVLVLDEIEYISPIAIRDVHWKQDFVDFWQTFWGCQSRYRNISAVIAGVNPSVVEIDNIDGIQNPLFGIVSYQYLRGFEYAEISTMLNVLGKRMGLKFKEPAKRYIFERYGGHPLLTRMACSLINAQIKDANRRKPVTITKEYLLDDEEERDSDLVFYCRHVVSELQQFYPEEYEMLELLASRQVSDFLELSTYPEFTKHLQSYGLLEYDSKKQPFILIPVVGRYIGLELARKENRRTIYKIIPRDDRNNWLIKRVNAITHDIRFLEKQIKRYNLPILFGVNSFPEADEFAKVKVLGLSLRRVEKP